jgi:glycosyltransferase involved in cell wall biosynthesis
MTFSIVITTYNRSLVLLNLLSRLEEQTDPNFEVIVAMDGCNDRTLDMLKNRKSSFPIRWVDTGYSGYGLALARNAGILAASDGVVAIIDDDSLPVPEFVAAHRAAVRSRCITGGPRDPYDQDRDPRLARKMIALRALPTLQPMTIPQIRETHPLVWLVENNISMMRADWISLGLFTERLRMYGVIGQEFFARAEYLGWRYQFDPNAGIIHREEVEGNNGLTRSRKMREVRIASLLRQGLMTPTQYTAQQAWALARAQGTIPPPLPPWWPAATSIFARRLLSGAARRLLKRR